MEVKATKEESWDDAYNESFEVAPAWANTAFRKIEDGTIILKLVFLCLLFLIVIFNRYT